MPTDWDAANVKVQLRVAAQRLGYARDRKDAQAQVTGRDITTLLQQGNVGIARAKAQKLIHDDVMGHLSEMLEMQIGVLLERFNDLESEFPSPAVVEAAATIVYAAQRDEFKDLYGVRDVLAHRFGPAFVNSSITNRDGYVSSQIVRALSMPPASVAEMNRYLADVAKTYGYRWRPELLPDDILNIISEILDGSNGTPVDMPRLRKVCAHGIPDTPSWLRPRTWRLLLGTLPPSKMSWETDAHERRKTYYDLARRLLEPFSNRDPPTDPLSPLDAALEDAVKDLFRIPPKLFAGLEEEPEPAPLCPFDDSAPDEIKIEFASVLDSRLLSIRSRGAEHPQSDIPEIRLEDDVGSSMPEFQEKNGKLPKLQTLHTGGAHPIHASALTRILYIHSRLNPAHKSPHLASILIPLYSVLNQEVEPLDLAHVEADTFWVFEAVVSEFAELEDDQGSTKWMRALSQRLQWADPDLFEDMSAKGLDPALPHYSYRWLAPILTHTLPVQAVLTAWDAIFSYPMTTPDSCPKLDHLVDICTSMLILARRPILCLGKPGRFPQGLWNEDNLNSPVSPAFGSQLDNAFVEGMTLLQDYSVQAAGGIESIVQIASELAQRRIMQVQPPKPSTPSVGLGSLLRDTLGRGFTNTAPSPESSDEEESTAEEESSDDEKAPAAAPTQQAPTITSRLAGAVWRGITNQSAMDTPPSPMSASPVSPLSPLSPLPNLPPPPSSIDETAETTAKGTLSPGPSTSILSYAEKLKDSDTAAALAKVSTNWRIMAMDAWNSRRAGNASSGSVKSDVTSPPMSAHSSPAPGPRISLSPFEPNGDYEPPPMPAFFKRPRDSWLPQLHEDTLIPSPHTPRSSPLPTPSRKGIRESIASFAGRQPVASKPKSGPRPLLLSSSTLITGSHLPSPTGSATSSPGARHRDSSDLMRNIPRIRPRDSQLSLSSATSGRHQRSDTRSDIDSDYGESRFVPLNRRSISPMAPTYRTSQSRPTSQSSTSDRNSVALPRVSYHAARRTGPSAHSVPDVPTRHDWGRFDIPDSPNTLPSSPPPRTPPSALNSLGISGIEFPRGSVVVSQPDLPVAEPPPQSRKLSRKRVPPALQTDETSDSSHVPEPRSKPVRMRSKRHLNQPTDLRIQSTELQPSGSSNSLTLPSTSDDPDAATTPRAATFEEGSDASDGVRPRSPRSPRRQRKASNDRQAGVSPRSRTISTDSRGEKVLQKSPSGRRTRKISGEAQEARKEQADSAAEEGDDEAYDDLLSAYESEDSVSPFSQR